jgi:hypothetical protein
MPSGGFRPGSGRKPGLLAKINTAARERALALVGSTDDPVQLALTYARDPDWPAALRTQLVLGLISVTYPRLVSQTVESHSVQFRVGAEALAAKTAALLSGRPGYEAEGELDGEAEGEAAEADVLADVLDGPE